ncbi:glycosyltransferase [Hyalangium rubrum]|uniref:Glycosyltransferase n=1 Tax=Hyalangium rubrum TaxID=3103134 RepID=A0ABU5HI60_9BACT|nr:glycosyltransferase [Hyalangium sp. s54d21]MDY7233134.1 glycosyltransferase [Hyalangium sp. s54d21]
MSALPQDTVDRHLHSFVLRRAAPGSRVLLLGKNDALARELACSGRELVSGEALDTEAWRRFAPTHVVLAESLPAEGLEARLRLLREAVPEAEILLGFANTGAASALLATLVDGTPARQGPSEASFAHCLSACRLRVVHREAHEEASRRTSLAEGAERALNQLLSQLSPGAGADVLLYVLARAHEEAPSVSHEPELLSVVLWNGPEHRHLLDEAVFSLACQRYRPLEIVLVEPDASAGDALRTLEKYQHIEDFRIQHVRGPQGGLMNEAIRRARGQYLAFFEASGLIYPGHFEKLIGALRGTTAAWAVSRAFRRVSRAIPGGDDYIETKVPFPLGDHLELAHFRQHPWLLHVFVIDRNRTASFPLSVPDPAPGKAAALPLRLAALFEPVFLNGLATCEQREPERDPPAMEPGTESLQVLRSWDALEQTVARASQTTKGLRHRALDGLNDRLRRWAPRLHGALRSSASRWLR